MRLIKIYKDNCKPCDRLSLLLSHYKAKPIELHIFDNGVAKQYKASSVPVLILEDDNGNEIDRVVGYKPLEVIKLIEQYK